MSSEHIDIASERWRLRLQPSMGLQTLSCKILHADQWHDLMPDCTVDNPPLNACNFHMLPYSNRIRDARFSHDEQDHILDHVDEHAIHGALRKLKWRVNEQSEHNVSAEFDSRSDGAITWPWPIHAKVSYTLTQNTLTSVMTLTNLGTTSMPAGMGWHPYFCRQIAGAEPSLTIPVEGVYPDTEGDCLPVGAAIALPKALQFSAARRLDSAQRIDHCLSGFKGPATLAWPEAGITLRMHASENCGHLVLYNPDEAFFAVEPVTNANDGFNLQNRDIDAGVIILEPGQSMSAQMQLELLA